MNIKELNQDSFVTRSKYKRHTGMGIKNSQKSRSHHEDKSRKWRKKGKDRISYDKRESVRGEIKREDFKCNDILKRTKLNYSIY